jgi:AraC-like DNA-binding protein/quercetin dioxygenase-like cupin family protein
VDELLLTHLRKITNEEKEILAGADSIDRALYMQGRDNTVNSRKLLSAGKLITVRPHTRFIPFPAHTHDYVEVVYMCEGTTTHTVGGQSVVLQQGELLFLSQSAVHQVSRAEESDVAVNLIVLPSFFDTALTALGEEETPLRRFLVDCLCGQNTGPGFLHFRVANVKPIQNLIENLLWSILQDTPNKRKTSQLTMALLFLQLIGHTETLASADDEEAATLKLLRYVESNYITGSLTEAAKLLHYDLCWLSREVKAKTGKTYTQLVQEKRLAQAAFLLRSTHRRVADISQAVGYENISYFHRIFTAAYGKSPKHYRDESILQERTLF